MAGTPAAGIAGNDGPGRASCVPSILRSIHMEPELTRTKRPALGEGRLRRGWTALALLLVGTSCQSMGSAESPPEPSERRLRVLAYNVYYVFDHGKEVEAGSAWIREQAPDLVALQELTNIAEERLEELAAGWGHEHAALLKTSGFSVGLTSAKEIVVVDRLLEGLHHGCLHAQVDGIHVFVVHLSPFRWEVRRDEARLLLAHIEPLLEAGHEVLVLGDFNALSPSDRALLEAQPEVLEKARASDAKHDHVTNLRDGALDFSVMQAFLDAGLQDPALPFLEARGDTRWTFTTGIWTEEKTTPPDTGTRIDFILADPTLARAAQNAQVVRTGIVNRTSDHYPVLIDFARDVRR